MSMNFFIETLGCDKNSADSRKYKDFFLENGFNEGSLSSSLDILLVNTCSFILRAKEQSIDRLLELIEQTNSLNSNVKIIVMGCLSEQYKEELRESIPEVSEFFGTISNDEDKLKNYILDLKSALENKDIQSATHTLESFEQLEESVTDYLKISDGCNKICSYCSIPNIKGKYKSVPKEELLLEAKKLYQNGIKELVVVAQDICDYGVDLKNSENLYDLLNDLKKIPFKWIRLHYVYPHGINDKLINLLNEDNNIVPYLDIPFQHGVTKILKLMNRGDTTESIAALIKKLRQEISGVSLRTTLIVGHPGETNEDFLNCVNFFRENKVDNLGAFTYSREENTLSYQMEEQIDEETKEARYDVLMNSQMENVEILNKKRIGEKHSFLCEVELEPGMFLGRIEIQSKDIDGVTYVKGDLKINEFYNITIIDNDLYDFIGGINNEG